MNSTQDDLQGAPLTPDGVTLRLRRRGEVMDVAAGRLASRRIPVQF